MDLSTRGLIADLELNALLPDGMFEDSDLISFLNDGFFSEVLAFVMRFREDFFVSYTDFAPAASIAIPSDAIAQKIKDVQIKKDDSTFYNLPRLSMCEITSGQSNSGFYIQDNNIIFYPRAQTNTIRVVYYKRPNYLADNTVADSTATGDSTTVYTVTDKTTDGLFPEIVVSPIPPILTGTLTRTLSKSYQPFDSEDITLTYKGSGTGFYVDAATYAKVTTGDCLCPVGYTAFPKIPIEARDVLVQAALVKAMTAMKDKDGYKLAKDSLAEAKAAIASLISPRIDNEVKKVVNLSSPLWSSRKGWRY